MNLRNWSALVMVLHCALFVQAQSGDNAPVVYDQFFQNYYLLNPATLITTDKAQFAIGNRTLTGLFEGVNRLYADGHFLLASGGNERAHFVGIQAINNRDGDFINRNRLYARYSWYTPLGEQSALSAGISLGIVNYSFKASASSAGGSATQPDANFGIWYLREHFQAGVAIQQMFRPQLQPISQTYRLDRYVNLNLIYKFSLSDLLALKTHAYYRYELRTPFYMEIAPVLQWLEKIEAGANYRQERGIAILAGLSNLPLWQGKFRCMASYLIRSRTFSGIDESVLELSLGYAFAR